MPQYPREQPIIEVKNIRKEYPLEDETVVALKRINLNIYRGEICCIFGTSGSGKSTLLNQLAGMEKPTRGCVYIGGVPISRLPEEDLAAFRQRHIGFVFQAYNLLPNLDSATTAEIMEMICGFARKFRQTIILVTHDPEMAAYADRVVKLIDGEIVSDERTPHSQTSPNPQTAR